MELDRRHSDSANMARLASAEARLAINENATAYVPKKNRKEKHTYQNTDIALQGNGKKILQLLYQPKDTTVHLLMKYSVDNYLVI